MSVVFRNFKPTEISDCELWLDANDTNTITFNGSNVAGWADKSGNGNNVIQSTATNQPTYQSSGINNKGSLYFDGNNFLARNSALGLTGNPALTVFIVSNITSTSQSRVIHLGASTTPQQNIQFAADASYRFNNGSLIFANDNFNDSTDHIAMFRRATGATYGEGKFYLDNIEATYTSVTNSGYILNMVNNVCRIGQGRDTGNNPHFITGQLGEIIIYNKELTTVEANQIFTYLKNKWGV